jgi:hypothetical protein
MLDLRCPRALDYPIAPSDQPGPYLTFHVQVGVFSAAAVLVYDLSDPFLGQYLITPTVLQLKTIRDTLPTGIDDQPPEADTYVVSAL